VFGAALQALKPGGRFVVDFMNTQLVLDRLKPREERVVEGVRFSIERALEQGTLVKRIHVSDPATGHDGRPQSFEERVLALMPGELEDMATAAGFTVEDRTGGPTAEPFQPDRSDRFVLWLRRAS
jgi:hypothetical protein